MLKKQSCCLRRVCGLLLSVLFLFFAVPFSGATEVPVYRSAKTEQKQIALTFDDGPHPMLTPRILEILAKHGVRATFFMVGVNVSNYPETARSVLQAGHEVGNHTYSHRHVGRLCEEELNDEMGRCEAVLEELCEYRPHLFRPPEGAVTRQVEHCTEQGDYALILWSLDTRDWEYKDTDAIVDAVLEGVQPGDIILMHDYIGTKSKTPEALERLLPELLRRGYEFVTVSQLLGIG